MGFIINTLLREAPLRSNPLFTTPNKQCLLGEVNLRIRRGGIIKKYKSYIYIFLKYTLVVES